MRLSFTWKFLLIVAVGPCLSQMNPLRIVCYFDNTTPYTQGNVKYIMDDINTTLCTHLVFNYATINFTTNYKESNWAANNQYNKFVGLKQKNPQLITMISLQLSWNYNMLRSLLSKEALRNTTMTNIVKFLRQYQFDGLDMYIGFSKLENWIISFAEILGQILKSEKYLFSIAVGSYAFDSISRDEISRLNRNLDFINIHAYEFRFTNNPQADHHAPLYKRWWDSNVNENVDSVVDKWIGNEFPSDKIVMAIPLFGISWTLSSDKTSPPVPAIGPGNLLPKARNRDGYIPYYEICQAVRSKNWKVYPKNEQMGPYAVSPYNYHYYIYRTWVGYDDPAMAIVKSEYILSKGLGGVAVADINMDDFLNMCGTGFNPMMTAIYNTIYNTRDLHPKPGFTQTFPISMETSTISHTQYSSTEVGMATTFEPETALPQSSSEMTSSQPTISIAKMTSNATTQQPPTSLPSSSFPTIKTSSTTTTHSMTSDGNTDINPTCNSSGVDFIILSVIFVFLLITLLFVLTKIFCGRKLNLIK